MNAKSIQMSTPRRHLRCIQLVVKWAHVAALLLVLIFSHDVAVAEKRFDTASIPGTLIELNQEFKAHVSKPALHWASTGTWLCSSTTDATTGACATNIDHGKPAIGKTYISLLFTHQSGVKKTILLEATRENASSPPIHPQPLNQTYPVVYVTDYVRVKIWAVDNQLALFNLGGKWSANLKLNHFAAKDNARAPGNDINIWISYDVVDSKNAGIYFVDASSGSDPLRDSSVSIPLISQNGQSVYTGSADVKMCLYDGNAGSSKTYSITVRQPETRKPDTRKPDIKQPEKKGFVLLDMSSGDGTQAGGIPLIMKLVYRGDVRAISNGEALLLNETPTKDLESIKIPRVLGDIQCATADLNISIPPIDALKVKKGEYRSTILLDFSASALSP